MHKYLERLIYRPDGERINFLSHLFFYTTFVFGIAFVFFSHSESVSQSILFQNTKHSFGHNLVLTWGTLALVVSVVNVLGIMFAKFKVIRAIAIVAFSLWLYALSTYFSHGLIFQFFATLPQAAFWAWYYFRLLKFKPKG